MESVEETKLNIFQEIANDEELAQIPKELAQKIHSHFNVKCDEFITAKAIFESKRKNLGKLKFGLYLLTCNEHLSFT